MCRSIGLPPMAHPPGMATRAIPARATSGPSTSELARMVFTISYLASGSESVRQQIVVRCWAVRSPTPPPRPSRPAVALGLDVPHLGNVLQDDLVLGQNRRRHAGQRRVFRARDANGAHQRIPAANDKFIHEKDGRS